MYQIFQNLRSGQLERMDIPCPQPGKGEVLIQTRISLISAGTERMLVEFAHASLLQKARQQPERVKQVLEKIHTDGLIPTLETVFRKLDEPMPLGYCNMGYVLATGEGVTDIKPGDRVVSNGPHAEVVLVPENLCAIVPEGVSDEQAVFTVLGSIALEGIRLLQPTLGERFMVFGMGILGLLTVQLLKANGCQVLAVDLNPQRLQLARSYGAETVDLSQGQDPVSKAIVWSKGEGVDGGLLCADAPDNHDIVHQAAEACRKRGRIILVGVVGLNLRRSDFYKKELTFQVSCSYGPGRYENLYEKKGFDYPLGYIRWTEKRNFEAILGAMQTGGLNVDKLITDRIPFAEAESAYEKITQQAGSLGVLFTYTDQPEKRNVIQIRIEERQKQPSQVSIGIIGAGGFTGSTILPCLKKEGVALVSISSRQGTSAVHLARKFHIQQATTDHTAILSDPKISVVFITTPHSTHAPLVIDALGTGKHVFVEKPLAISPQQLSEIKQAVQSHPDRHLMVGFNRRFSPHIQKIRQLIQGRSEPLCLSMTVNGGPIPKDHWIQDPMVGGGRIIGEGCHFLDLFVFLTGSLIRTVAARSIGADVLVPEDKMAIILGFEDGSVGTLNYFSNGSKGYPKESLEIFSEGRVLTLDNFHTTRGYGTRGFRKYKTWRIEKGHQEEIHQFLACVQSGGASLIPFAELENVTLASFSILESARTGQVISL